MEVFEFNDIKFVEKNDHVRAIFLEQYYFKIDSKALDRLGKWKVVDKKIEINSKKSIDKKFFHLINEGFSNLYNILTGRKTLYIHQNSGIPLLGCSYFGITDRNTNLIEIRPNTGCNLNCIYCSVNEGFISKKGVDFVIEKDYLIQELKRHIAEKNVEDIEIHINPQGEPLLYAPLVDLVKGISEIDNVERISMDTNGVLLNEDKVDKLFEAGLTQFNISIDSLDKDKAKEIAECNYSVDHIQKICRYVVTKGKLLIAPLWLPGINDSEIEKLIVFAKELGARIGIQNFLSYKNGRNPVKARPMEDFYADLKELEKKHDMKLAFTLEDFLVQPTEEFPNPFKKADILRVEPFSEGRLKHELLAVAKGRTISIKDAFGNKKSYKVRIVRTKHNIITAVPVNK